MKISPSFWSSALCRKAWLVPLLLVTIASAVRGDVPRPEHPRPDAYRANWQSINGQWQFEIDSKPGADTREMVSGRNLEGQITVPFCPESKLSGIGNTALMKNVWYRRLFDQPAAMKGKRVLLHFGAVDYKSWVWLNGQLLGVHIGGNVSFSYDITPYLRASGNELVVHAFDDTASGDQPTGKQTHTVSHDGDYTRTTGIWQSVWLESVGSTYINDFFVTPDADKGRVTISASVEGPDKNLILKVQAFANGKLVGEDSAPAIWRSNQLVLDLRHKQLWEPGKPFLYDLKFTLSQGKRTIDEVSSYFGLRKVSIEGRSILINNKRVFQRLILDQGFYPDGIWTAPSDEALKHDIEMSMAAGYNGARLHQKVFEPRFLYWADKLGYIVWGEYSNSGFNWKSENYSGYINEWTAVVQRDRNHPAIIGWCPMNETPPQAAELQGIIWNETKALDPMRLVLETSGWTHTLPNSEIRDDHDYTMEPERMKQRWINFFADRTSLSIPVRYGNEAAVKKDLGGPFIVSEFGGTGYDLTPNGVAWGRTPKTKEEFYTRYQGLVDALLDNPDICGFCYTQLTDVEQEQNGFYYYDRRPKFDIKRIHDITSRRAAYEKTGPVTPPPPITREPQYQVLVGAAADGDLAKPYRSTTKDPGADWTGESFDDEGWTLALAPFGTTDKSRTRWDTADIWLRQNFEWDGTPIKSGALVISYDEDTEVYVNGQKVWSRIGFINNYAIYEITSSLKKALHKGKNTLSVHTRQTGGGQFIDLALLTER